MTKYRKIPHSKSLGQPAVTRPTCPVSLIWRPVSATTQYDIYDFSSQIIIC
jgi:hypothetical protein